MFGGGGPMVVHRLDRPGRFEVSSCQYVTGHSGAVLDIDWSPFDDSLMATASEDTDIKLWSIPEDWEPIDESGNAKAGKGLSESILNLDAHSKKVTLLRFHPTANNTLLSTSGDLTVKVWDVENGAPVHSFGDVPNLVHDIVWDHKGDNYAFSCKDKKVRLVDGRTGELAQQFKAHEGAKSIKLVYINGTDYMFSCGASKQSSREIKVWDRKDLSKPLHTESIDTAAGAMIPLWDSDTNVLYLCGKGDGVIRLYEFEGKEPFIYKLNDGFRSNMPGKGYCLVPKRGLNIMKHETARILKVTNEAGVQPLTFTVPRKSDAFQDDIFPETASTVPAHSSCQEWLEGDSKDPCTMSLAPGRNGVNGNGAHTNGAGGASNGTSANGAPKKAFKTVAGLSKELSEAKKRIEYLEGKLNEASIEY
jgi:coronin-1B/1C/6